MKKFSNEVDIKQSQKKHSELWTKYGRLRVEVLKKMAEADKVAEKLRRSFLVRHTP